VSDVPTKLVTLREMVEAMSHYSDDEPFRWFAAKDVNLCVTFGQVRKELAGQKILTDDLDDLSCCECDAALDDQGACPNESCCEWRGLAEPVQPE